jgi:pilus assembly protein Flp/PilA
LELGGVLVPNLIDRRGDDGASAVEYALLVTAIAGIIVLLAFTIGQVVLHGMFEKTCDNIKNQATLTANCT